MALNKDDDELKNVVTEALDRHNFYRKKHNVSPLKINSKVCNHKPSSLSQLRHLFTLIKPELNEFSQNWANELAKIDKASHRPNNSYGENIFIMKSTEQVIELGVKAVDSWYSEIKFFDLQGTNDAMAASTKAFHFTQVIWKDSNELGVGASKSPKSGKLYVVCNYDPHGNVRSQFKDQVLPSIVP